MDIQSGHHFIQFTLVKTMLRAITAMNVCGDHETLAINIPACLSTTDPTRRIMGVWRTPVGQQMQLLLKQEADAVRRGRCRDTSTTVESVVLQLPSDS